MNAIWRQFLLGQDAHLEEDFVQGFSAFAPPAAQTKLCDLSHVGVLRVDGDDAQSFLNNMLSNDVSALAVGQSQYSSFNTAQGRVLATLTVSRDEVGFWLELPRAQLAFIHKKLAMYVLRAKVKLTDLSDQQVSFGLIGEESKSIIINLLGVTPEKKFSSVCVPPVRVTCLDEAQFKIDTTPERAAELWNQLGDSVVRVGTASWDEFNIRAGVPMILPETREQFVLQMINLDVLGGVSFKKGCYPGQEIVARMHYLGAPKRRMFLAHIEQANAPQPGAALFTAEPEAPACGMIVNAARGAAGAWVVLAVVQIATQAAQPVHLDNASGAVLQFLPLPYSLP